MLATGVGAGFDEGLGRARAARLGRDEQVVHGPDPRRTGRRPRPEHGGEPDRSRGLVDVVIVNVNYFAGEVLHALACGIGDQRPAEAKKRHVRRRGAVEVAVGAHEREQVLEVLLADG
jgi:hypothetical protein